MAGQKDKDKMGRWAGDGIESKERLNHVQKKCEGNAVSFRT